VHHGFSLREIESIPSLDNFSSTISIINQGSINYKCNLQLSFEDIFHIKNGVRNQYTFQDKELKGGLYDVILCDNPIEDNKDSENNFKTNRASTQELNTRKSKTYSFNANSKLKAKVDLSRRIINSRTISLAKDTFEVNYNFFFKSSSIFSHLLLLIF